MKRLLVFLVLAMAVPAMMGAPAYAHLDPKAGAPVATGPHSAAAVGVATTQGSTASVATIGGRGMPNGTRHASRVGTATGVGIAVILVLVVGGAVFALAASRRHPAPAQSAGAPVRLPGYKTAADQKRRAA